MSLLWDDILACTELPEKDKQVLGQRYLEYLYNVAADVVRLAQVEQQLGRDLASQAMEAPIAGKKRAAQDNSISAVKQARVDTPPVDAQAAYGVAPTTQAAYGAGYYGYPQQ